MFWNTKTGGRHIKPVGSLSYLSASGDHVVTSYSSVESQLVLMNSIGAEIDEIKVPFTVKFISHSKNFACAASTSKGKIIKNSLRRWCGQILTFARIRSAARQDINYGAPGNFLPLF